MRPPGRLAAALIVIVLAVAACDSTSAPASSTAEQPSESSTAPTARDVSTTTATVGASSSTVVPEGLIASAGSPHVYLGALQSGDLPPACPRRTDITVAPSTLTGDLSSIREWVEVSLPELVAVLQAAEVGAAENRHLRLAGPTTTGFDGLVGTGSVVFLWSGRSDPSEQWLFDPGIATLASALRGSRALVALNGGGTQGVGRIFVIAIEQESGELAMVGPCGLLNLAHRVAEYADEIGAASPYAVLRDIAADANALADFGRWAG